MTSIFTHFRLSTVTFFLYFALGAFTPVFGLYLTDRLHFSGRESGLIMSASALSALVSPLVCSFLADRVISAERLFGILLIGGGGLMGVLFKITAFWPFLLVYLLYTVTVGATGSLSNAIIFHQVGDRREYGRIRVWGSLGWIAVAWVFGWLWLRGTGGAPMPQRLPDALLLCALTMVALGCYSFTLPASVTPDRRRQPEFFPRAAFAILRRPEVLGLAMITLAANITDRTYYYATAIFLKQSGVAEANVMPLMSLGQIPEVFGMIFLGRLITRLGLVPVMLLGSLFNIARYLFFIFGGGPVTLILGILMHGFAYAFFFAAVFILLDGLTEKESRAGVHQLFTLVYSGLGALLGSWIAGAILDACKSADGHTVNFHRFWFMPLTLAVAVTLALLVWYRRTKPALPPLPAAAPALPSPGLDEPG